MALTYRVKDEVQVIIESIKKQEEIGSSTGVLDFVLKKYPYMVKLIKSYEDNIRDLKDEIHDIKSTLKNKARADQRHQNLMDKIFEDDSIF